MTRRALLTGGAVALLAAGCGEEDDVVAAPADALGRALDAEAALAAATRSLPAGAPRSAVSVVRKVNARALARMRRLEAAGAPPSASEAGAATADEAVARARAAIVAHVIALPSLGGRERRALAAGLVEGAAADTALLSDALGMPVHDPFPGTPR